MKNKDPYDRGIKRPIRALGRAMMHLNRTALMKRLNETERLEKRTWGYTHPLWPLSADGFSVLFVSDIHYGPLLSGDQWDRLTAFLREDESDCVLLGGDYGETPGDALSCIEKLGPILKGRRVIAAAGNHDLIGGDRAEMLAAAGKEAGWEILFNGCVPLTPDVQIAVVDDLREGRPDVGKVRSESGKASFTLLMTHNPDVLADIDPPFYHLALCGHTHGGQVTVFGRAILSSSIYRQRYLTGWRREKNADILIGNGVGASLLPVRSGAIPQVLRIVFGSGPAEIRLLDVRTAEEKETKKREADG